MQVVAEGAELPIQIARLDQLGCTWIQGYSFTEPGPLGADLFEFEQRL
jgi:EAL domain-containing protein (putative c-di-GMP-specific phosphodiesterase class I)